MTTSQGRESRGGNRPPARRFSGRRRRQCVCKEVGTITYRDVSVLRRFISDRGRIESGRKAGNCAKCQRQLGKAIARARFLALLPYAPNHLRVTGSISSPTSTGADDEADTEDEELLDDIDDESEDDLDGVDSSEDDDSED
jgi:small subunit ribosomal protein S18